MKRFECVIAPVKTPQEEETVIVEATDLGQALIVNHNERPGTFVKSCTEITEQE